MNGKRIFFYGKTKAEVKKKMASYKEESTKGALFSDAADGWWEEAMERLEFNTVRGYHSHYTRAVEAFGVRRLNEITPVMISAELSAFAKDGYATKTVRQFKLVLNLIFRYAIEHGMATFDPVSTVRVPDGTKSVKRHAPSPEDIQRVKENVGIPFGLFPFMAMYTGLRKGELLALTWDDIDTKARTITVNKSICHPGNHPTIKHPKTETSVGVVPIVDALLPYVQRKQSGVVFPNSYGGYLSETQFKRKWEDYCRATGVTATSHQFRHAYATMLFEAGIPPERMQALLRHAQLATTMDVYKDLRSAELQRIHESVYNIDIR